MTSKFDQIFENIMQDYDRSKVRGGSIVEINPKALKNKEIREKIYREKGEAYLAQLEKMANEKLQLFVSALKTVRPTRADGIAETHVNNWEEADVVNQKYPGLYSAPMTLPVSILQTVTDPSDVMQHPIDSDVVHKPKLDSGKYDDSYNTGKQPKGTRNNK